MECRVTFWNRIAAAAVSSAWLATVVAGSYAVLTDQQHDTLMLVAIVACWIMSLLLIPFLGPLVFSMRPIIELSAEGIDDKRLRLGLIPWADVKSFDTYSVNRRPYAQFWLRDEGAYTIKWPRWRRILGNLARAIGYSPFSISFTFLTPGFESTCAYIRRYAAERRDS